MAEVRYNNFEMDPYLTGYFDVDAGNTLVNAPQQEDQPQTDTGFDFSSLTERFDLDDILDVANQLGLTTVTFGSGAPAIGSAAGSMASTGTTVFNPAESEALKFISNQFGPEAVEAVTGGAAASGSTAAGFPGMNPISSCLLYTSPSPRDGLLSRMPSSA